MIQHGKINYFLQLTTPGGLQRKCHKDRKHFFYSKKKLPYVMGLRHSLRLITISHHKTLVHFARQNAWWIANAMNMPKSENIGQIPENIENDLLSW